MRSPKPDPVKTRPARAAPPPLSREMTRLLAMLAKKSGAMDPALAERWGEIAGPQLAKLCRPTRLRRYGRASALEVAAVNGAAAMQVQFRQRELIDAVNRVLGRGKVTRLTIRQTGSHAAADPGTAGGFSHPVMPPDDATPAIASARAPAQDLAGALERLRANLQRAR